MKRHFLSMVLVLLACVSCYYLFIVNNPPTNSAKVIASCSVLSHDHSDFGDEMSVANSLERDLESIQQLLMSPGNYWSRPGDEELEFLSKIEEKNAKSMVRNGNYCRAVIAKENYVQKLNSFKKLCTDLQVSIHLRKRDFGRTLGKLSPGQRQRLLRSWSRKRSALRKAARAYRKQLRFSLATERAIRRQQKHFPELTARINALYNFDNSKLPVYVFFHSRTTKSLEAKLGLSIISYYKGLFTTESPAAHHLYPDLPAMEKALTVHLTSYPSGKTLSHEFGHLHYLYHHWFDYQRYIQLMGTDYEPGGHGEGDPSGIAANLAEKGILIE